MKTIGFGIIGCGLMGREFASSVARWCHLTDMPAKPRIVSICNRSDRPFEWFTSHFPEITQVTHDYHAVLENPEVEAVYIAVPHDQHERMYIDAIKAGKHLMGEKPFGIDLSANRAILACCEKHPDVFVRCCSQMPFFPAVQEIGRMIASGELGTILEVETGFLHSSDMNQDKPINWKRKVEHNGAYGVMGDLGMHVCHVPFRAGWKPLDVRAVLCNVVQTRPDAEGHPVPCETWDNATLLIRMENPVTQEIFPWTLKSFRIAPGEKNTWYVKILGTKTSVRFSTKNPKLLEKLVYDGGEQTWGQIDMGIQTAYPCITGGIFEFGFSDAVQQMWAGFIYELVCQKPISSFGGCVLPQEAALSHRLFTAALTSHLNHSTEVV